MVWTICRYPSSRTFPIGLISRVHPPFAVSFQYAHRSVWPHTFLATRIHAPRNCGTFKHSCGIRHTNACSWGPMTEQRTFVVLSSQSDSPYIPIYSTNHQLYYNILYTYCKRNEYYVHTYTHTTLKYSTIVLRVLKLWVVTFTPKSQVVRARWERERKREREREREKHVVRVNSTPFAFRYTTEKFHARIPPWWRSGENLQWLIRDKLARTSLNNKVTLPIFIFFFLSLLLFFPPPFNHNMLINENKYYKNTNTRQVV